MEDRSRESELTGCNVNGVHLDPDRPGIADPASNAHPDLWSRAWANALHASQIRSKLREDQVASFWSRPGANHVARDQLHLLTNPFANHACCSRSFLSRMVIGMPANALIFQEEFACQPTLGSMNDTLLHPGTRCLIMTAVKSTPSSSRIMLNLQLTSAT